MISSVRQSGSWTMGGVGTRTGTTAVEGGGAGPMTSAGGREILGLDLGLEALSFVLVWKLIRINLLLLLLNISTVWYKFILSVFYFKV